MVIIERKVNTKRKNTIMKMITGKTRNIQLLDQDYNL